MRLVFQNHNYHSNTRQITQTTLGILHLPINTTPECHLATIFVTHKTRMGNSLCMYAVPLFAIADHDATARPIHTGMRSPTSPHQPTCSSTRHQHLHPRYQAVLSLGCLHLSIFNLCWQSCVKRQKLQLTWSITATGAMLDLSV